MPKLIDTLVDAFIDDPLYRWLYPEPTSRPQALRANMQFILDLAHARGRITATPALDGIAVWTEPGVELLDDPGMFVDFLRTWAPEHVEAALTGIAACAAHQPPGRHYQLHLLAVHPDRQGQGVGARLIQPLLERCEEEAATAYLESSNPRNVAFYQRNGFEVLADIKVEGAGPVMRPMARFPHAGSPQLD